jgi:hypothetical protein
MERRESFPAPQLLASRAASDEQRNPFLPRHGLCRPHCENGAAESFLSATACLQAVLRNGAAGIFHGATACLQAVLREWNGGNPFPGATACLQAVLREWNGGTFGRHGLLASRCEMDRRESFSFPAPRLACRPCCGGESFPAASVPTSRGRRTLGETNTSL